MGRKKKPDWVPVQDAIFRQILAEMGSQRLTAATVYRTAGISASHWSEIKNCNKPASVACLIKICQVLGLTFSQAISAPPALNDQAKPCRDTA